jgi:hypothetical protein
MMLLLVQFKNIEAFQETFAEKLPSKAHKSQQNLKFL